jgi:hypothetical protein
MTFQSLLDKEPLLHEPGIRPGHSDFNSYHQMVEYYNYKFACLTLLKDLPLYVPLEPSMIHEFQEFMNARFRENKASIREILESRIKHYPERKSISIGLYGGIIAMLAYDTVMADYKAVVDTFPTE